MKVTPKIRHVVPLFAAAVLLAANSASAKPVITTADGNGADTSLQNDSQNGGTSGTVFGDGAGADFRRFDDTRSKAVFLRFDTTDLTGDLNNAILSFDYFSNRERDLLVVAMTDESLDNWDEATTAYNNAPIVLQPDDGGAAYDSGVFSLANASLLGMVHIVDTRNLPGGRTLASSNTTDLPLGTFLSTTDTNNLVSFLLIHSGTDNNQTGSIATKENTGGMRFPTLSTIPVPEPASAALLAVGGLAVVALRRRK